MNTYFWFSAVGILLVKRVKRLIGGFANFFIEVGSAAVSPRRRSKGEVDLNQLAEAGRRKNDSICLSF